MVDTAAWLVDRGQITTLVRQLGAPAPRGVDLVAFYRERQSR